MSKGYKLRGGYRVSDEWEGRLVCTSDAAELTWWDVDAGSAADLMKGMAECRACPIVDQCLAEAERNRETGVFGGRVLIAGRVVPLAKWLARRNGQDVRPREVVGHRECLGCGERFEVVAPKYAQKWCDECRPGLHRHGAQNSEAEIARRTRAARRRAEVAGRLAATTGQWPA